MSDWPDPKGLGGGDAAKVEYWKAAAGALVEVEKQRRLDALAAPTDKAAEERLETLKAEKLAELEIHKEAAKARLEVAKSGVERARDNAKFVQIAAAGLGTAYTGVATLAFSSSATHLPPRGFIPTLFFGVAVALATLYLAFMVKPENATDLEPSDLPRLNAQLKVDLFVLWVREGVLARAPLLRGAAIALLFGVVALPVAMITPAAATDTTPPAAAAEPTWPPFPDASPIELAAVLYAAQLEEFREAQDAEEASATSPASTDDVEGPAWLATVIGMLIVFLITWPFWSKVLGDRQDRDGRPGSQRSA